MQRQSIVIRDPLLDPNQRLLGYQLYYDTTGKSSAITDDEAQTLLQHVLGRSEKETDAISRYIFFLPTTVATLLEGTYAALSAGEIGLIVTPDVLANEKAAELLNLMRADGYEIMLRGADLTALHQDQLQLVTLIEVHFEARNFSAQARIFSLLKNSALRMAAAQVTSWQEYAICHKLGLHAFVGAFFMQPPPDVLAGNAQPLNPSQSTLLQLMEGVRANADTGKLEEILKRDATLSYKLLFYINSAAFGLNFEIESLRHAITLLGYERMNRWLCVLFATTGTAKSSPLLLHTALVRGRMVELLGSRLLSHSESEGLFITGMFSMLDRLLATSMTEALEHVRLPQPVVDALLDHEGVYAPFLQLALAAEHHDASIDGVLDALGLTTEQLNTAHVEALFWAQRLLG